MATITYSTMKTRVALNCGNLPSTHPVYTYLGDFVNDAANAVILFTVRADRKNVNLFPELKRRWSDVTVNNQGYLDKPTNLLILDSVSITRSTTTYDPSRHTEYPVFEEVDQARFGQFNKATTTVGWPTRWCEAASQILLWPTPTTAYLTQTVVRGIKREVALTSADGVFTMSDIWHPIVIAYATHLAMLALERYDGAEAWLNTTEKRIAKTVDPLGLSKRRNRIKIEIASAGRSNG